MGVVGSKIQKAARRFNVESRAERVISKEKPERAPRHPADEKRLHNISFDEKTKEELVRKDLKLDHYLKDVYVTSFDPPAVKNPKFAKPSERDRLPQFRGIVEETELGVVESEDVPEGKLSLRQAMKILADHKGDPVKNNARNVSQQYKIPVTVAENMLSHFGSLNVQINEPNKEALKLRDVDLTPRSRPTVVAIGGTASRVPPKIPSKVPPE